MKKVFLILVSLAFFSLSLIGCSKKESVGNDFDVKKEFITAYFTTDYNERYSDFLASENLDAYYQAFADIATTECLNTLAANREPLKYEMRAAENGESVSVTDVSFEVYDENVFSFAASLETTSDGGKESSQSTGQITVTIEKGREKVSHIYIAE